MVTVAESGRGFHRLFRTPVGGDLVVHALIDESDRAVLRQRGFHNRFFIALPITFVRRAVSYKFRDFKRRAQLLEVAVVIILHGVMPKMQIVLQFVGIQIILPVEISYAIVFCVQQRVRQVGNPQRAKEDFIHIVRTGPAARAAADIIDMTPETVGQLSGAVKITEVLQQYCGITVRNIFQHVVQAVLEHDRVVDLAHLRADNTRLTQTHPVFQPGLDHKPFRRNLGDGIVVIDTWFDGVAYASQ